MPLSLPETAKAWIDGTEFATVATLEPDGRPQLSVVWLARDGDDIVFSTVKGRRKQRNLERDPRATALVFPVEDPYTYLEVRGSVTMTEEGGRDLIDALHQKYRARPGPYPGDSPETVRVVVRLRADQVVFYD